jgi:hypothetical protein
MKLAVKPTVQNHDSTMPSVTDNGRGKVGDDGSMRFRPPNRWSILLSLKFGGENTCRSYCRSLAGVESMIDYGSNRSAALRYFLA